MKGFIVFIGILVFIGSVLVCFVVVPAVLGHLLAKWTTGALELRVKNWVQKKIQARVAEINAKHGLSFDAELEHVLLGEENQGFMAFDQQHRKLAICSFEDKTFCRIEDFSWLRGWSHTWESRGDHISHRIELETADLNCPVLFFLASSQKGPEWIARLDLLING